MQAGARLAARGVCRDREEDRGSHPRAPGITGLDFVRAIVGPPHEGSKAVWLGLTYLRTSR